MRQKNGRGGFSLIEVVVAIALLGLVVVPICGGLVLSFRLNARTEALMQAQLAVSSVVETLMSEGITGASGSYGVSADEDRFPGVTVATSKDTDTDESFTVTVTSTAVPDVSVTTHIRPAEGGDSP